MGKVVQILSETSSMGQLDAGLRVERRVEGHLNVLFVRADPAAAYAALRNGAVQRFESYRRLEELSLFRFAVGSSIDEHRQLRMGKHL